jgi:hypothetical protein
VQFNKKTRKKKYIALDLGFTIQTDISNYINIQYQPKGNAEIDLKEIIRGQYDFDVKGHYARPDIFKLEINEKENKVSERKK